MTAVGIEVSVDESRYDRQERVSWWDQKILSEATVLVVGAGALGNEVVKNLALVGVGRILVIDRDVVEASNLARCVFFRAEDEGNPKAEVLARRAAELNPDVRIAPIVGDVRSLGTGIAYRVDAIVGALDNREARLYCNRLAARSGRSWIDGAIEALSGVARVFNPPEVCYECTLTEADWEILAHRQSCRLLSREDLEAGKVPTTASTASIVAGLEAQEVVKLLHAGRQGVSLMRGAIVFDGANNDAYSLTYPVDPDCLAHHYYEAPTALRLDAAEFASVTVRELIARAIPGEFGARKDLVLDLGDDHVTHWRCPHCDRDDPCGRPAILIASGDSLCPLCETLRQPVFLSSLPLAGESGEHDLASLGVRPDEVLEVRSGAESQFVWIEFLDPRVPTDWFADAASSSGASGKGE